MSKRYRRVPRGPELREREAFCVVGLSVRVDANTKAQIPKLWQRFSPIMHEVPGWDGKESFGACYGMNPASGEFTYLAGVATKAQAQCEGLDVCTIPSASYEVFTHGGSLGHIQDTVGYIFEEWLPDSDYQLAGTPDFELYDDRFDPSKDSGELEYWVPVKKR